MTIELDACPECDLLIKPSKPFIGEKSHCPRCGYLLQRPRANSVERSLALALAGLILFFPANLLPLVDIKILGNVSSSTLWSGVTSVFAEGFWAVAILILMASMVFPLINLFLALFLSAHLHLNLYSRYLSSALKLLQHLQEWAMLEVYTLGIIVACVKLSSMSDIHFGFGLYAFVVLLIVNVMLTSTVDHSYFWRQIDVLRNRNEN